MVTTLSNEILRLFGNTSKIAMDLMITIFNYEWYICEGARESESVFGCYR